ncbi:MAG: DUF2905 domain-containing protein, partial [Acidimicrobiia bacterium]|nr:DUF2905 domain-containing protein [Acidimicrobiia bacterium]
DLPPDISDRIRVEATTQFQLNPAGPYQFFEQDPMGVPGLTYDPNVAGFDQAPGAFDFAIPQGWVPPSFGSSPTFGELLAGFVGLPAPPPGFDDMLSGDQPFPVDGAIIVPPAGDLLPPANTPWIVRGARLADPMPEGFCAGKILEFFSGDAVPGQPTWVPADFAPNDSFAGLSTAFATRCIDGQLQPTQMLVNNGSSFQPQGTFATAVIYPDAFFQLVPVTDIPASDGWRAGAFATDASNPFQPDNSGFSTFPTYPDLVPGSRPNVFIEPVMPGYPTFPVAFEFMGINGTDLDYENNFGLVVDPTQPGDDPAEFKVDLVQYDTWQISSGLLRYADDTQTLEGTLSGSGDGYSEEYDFGADTYVHEADTVDEFNFAFAPDDSVAGPFLTYLQEQFGVRQASIETTTTSVATSTSQAGAGQETTTTAAPTASGSSGPFLWLIVLGILLIVAGFVLWLLFGRKKPDPCAELYTAWQKAKAACDEATSEAKTKRQEAEGARTAREAADRTLDDHCTKYPPACGPQASVSSGDRTVTRDDVYVNRAWNAAAWKKYKDGGSAEATQDDWNNGPTDEFRDTALKELDAAKAK